MAMTKTIVYADITRYRDQYYHEQKHKPVAISPYLEISIAAVDKWEPITVQFHGCGGWQNFYAVKIVGGPDDGKVVDTYPWHQAEGLEYGATVYNGNREEYDRCLGYPSRPSIRGVSSGLHAVTVSYLIAMLESMRERDMSNHLLSLYDRLDKEQTP